jgi:hypothetical protein
VFRGDATTHVATMENVLPEGDFTNEKLVRKAMRIVMLTLNAKAAVASNSRT